MLIMAKEITHPEHMTIITNGGVGSDGQDGGNGKHGKDGTGKCRSEFSDEFPAVASMDVVRHVHLNTTLENLKKPWINVEVRKLNYRHPLKLAKNYLGLATTVFSLGNVSSDSKLVESCYIKCKTDDGHKITFSFQDGDVLPNCQAFLLYEGSPGTPGMPGGEYGMGGQGGKAGEVTVQCLALTLSVEMYQLCNLSVTVSENDSNKFALTPSKPL